MEAKSVTLKLTDEQKKAIEAVFGSKVEEIKISAATILRAELRAPEGAVIDLGDLDRVTGGRYGQPEM